MEEEEISEVEVEESDVPEMGCLLGGAGMDVSSRSGGK